MSILPTFMESSFNFAEEVPRHIDAYPHVPTYVGGFAVFGATSGNKTYPLALDVPDLEMARQLAEARKLKQEETIELYGYSDDVYIQLPNGKHARIYSGREAE